MITHKQLKELLYEQGKTQREVAKMFGVSESYISKQVKKYGLSRKIDDKYIGKRFGILTGIRVYRIEGNSHRMVECLCDCGKTINVFAYSLSTGNTRSCGCKSRKRGQEHALYRGYEGLRMSHWTRIQKQASSRGYCCDITIEEAWKLYEKQGRRCAISGLPIFFASTNGTYSSTTASLDRKDNTIGYVSDNVQWVHKKINQIKMDLDQDSFFHLCKTVVAYNNL